MLRLLGNHTPVSALKRAISLVRGMGLARTLSMVMATVDDKYLRSFDRRYRVKTPRSSCPSKPPSVITHSDIRFFIF
jgi:predicted RNA polymerase sigma factor